MDKLLEVVDLYNNEIKDRKEGQGKNEFCDFIKTFSRSQRQCFKVVIEELRKSDRWLVQKKENQQKTTRKTNV